MPHAVYSTKAFVIATGQAGEANKYIVLFTERFGMLHATAQGVRKEVSKLRYSLQPYQYINVSLVRGREVWRVVGAEETDNLALGSKDVLKLFARLFRFIQNLIHGEEQVRGLFADLEQVRSLIRGGLPASRYKILETIVQLRTLYELGYLKEVPLFAKYLEGELNTEKLEEAESSREEIERLADEAVLGSGL